MQLSTIEFAKLRVRLDKVLEELGIKFTETILKHTTDGKIIWEVLTQKK